MAIVMTMNGLYDTDKKAFVDSVEAAKPPATEKDAGEMNEVSAPKKKPRKTAKK